MPADQRIRKDAPMSWYSGPVSLGICHACGSPISDGGQSGAYCSNPRCPNSYLGGKTREQLDSEDAGRRRKSLEEHEGWWTVSCTDNNKPYPRGFVSGLVPTRDEAARHANRERARGLTDVTVSRVVDGELVEVDDPLTN